MAHTERTNIAVFIDFDNIEIGVKSTLGEHFDIGTILEALKERGEVVTKISGQEQRTFKTGEMFFEPPGATHEVSRNASETKPARLLAMIFAKKNSPLTAPA